MIERQVSAFKDGVVSGAEENIYLGIPFSLTAPAYCHIFETLELRKQWELFFTN